MDFSIPADLAQDLSRYKRFLDTELGADLEKWYRSQKLSRTFFKAIGAGGGYGIRFENGRLAESSALREALLTAELAKKSPGAAIAALAHSDLGLMAVLRYASPFLHKRYGAATVSGRTIMCLGNSENTAGSDVAAVKMTAKKTTDGWLLEGTKAWVTNGAIADMAVVTAVTDPEAARNRRHSMFLVDLSQEQIQRRRLKKQVWIPSDLTRLVFNGAHRAGRSFD